jgi:hypothetical protein
MLSRIFIYLSIFATVTSCSKNGHGKVYFCDLSGKQMNMFFNLKTHTLTMDDYFIEGSTICDLNHRFCFTSSDINLQIPKKYAKSEFYVSNIESHTSYDWKFDYKSRFLYLTMNHKYGHISRLRTCSAIPE